MEKLSNFGFRHLRPVYDCHFVSDSTYSTLVGTNIVSVDPETDSQSSLISFPPFASQLPSRLLRINSFVLPSSASQLPSSSLTDSLAPLFASRHSLHDHLRIRSLSFPHLNSLFTYTYGFIRSPYGISTLSSRSLSDSYILVPPHRNFLLALTTTYSFSLSIRVITLSLRLLSD